MKTFKQYLTARLHESGDSSSVEQALAGFRSIAQVFIKLLQEHHAKINKPGLPMPQHHQMMRDLGTQIARTQVEVEGHLKTRSMTAGGDELYRLYSLFIKRANMTLSSPEQVREVYNRIVDEFQEQEGSTSYSDLGGLFGTDVSALEPGHVDYSKYKL